MVLTIEALLSLTASLFLLNMLSFSPASFSEIQLNAFAQDVFQVFSKGDFGLKEFVSGNPRRLEQSVELLSESTGYCVKIVYASFTVSAGCGKELSQVVSLKKLFYQNGFHEITLSVGS